MLLWPSVNRISRHAGTKMDAWIERRDGINFRSPRPKNALQMTPAGHSRDPDHAGKILLANGDRKGAAEEADAALELDPHHPKGAEARAVLKEPEPEKEQAPVRLPAVAAVTLAVARFELGDKGTIKAACQEWHVVRRT